MRKALIHRNSATAICATALWAVLAGNAHADDGVRLFVADAQEPVIHVVDPSDMRPVATFETDIPARVSADPDSGIVIATQRDDDQVTFLDGTDIALIGTHELPQPTHVVPSPDGIGVFSDGEGALYGFSPTDLAAGRVEPRRIDAGVPHHGNGRFIGDQAVTSYMEEEQDGLPDSIRAHPTNGEASVHDCPALHGSEVGPDWVLFFCADAINVLDATNELALSRLDYPDVLADSRLFSGERIPGTDWVLGVNGDVVVAFQPLGGDTRSLTLPGDSIGGALDADGLGLSVTDDGAVHLVDVLGEEIVASLPADTLQTIPDGEDNPAFQQVVMLPEQDTALVGSSVSGTVHAFNYTDDSLEYIGGHDIAGEISSLAVVREDNTQ